MIEGMRNCWEQIIIMNFQDLWWFYEAVPITTIPLRVKSLMDRTYTYRELFLEITFTET